MRWDGREVGGRSIGHSGVSMSTSWQHKRTWYGMSLPPTRLADCVKAGDAAAAAVAAVAAPSAPRARFDAESAGSVGGVAPAPPPRPRLRPPLLLLLLLLLLFSAPLLALLELGAAVALVCACVRGVCEGQVWVRWCRCRAGRRARAHARTWLSKMNLEYASAFTRSSSSCWPLAAQRTCGERGGERKSEPTVPTAQQAATTHLCAPGPAAR